VSALDRRQGARRLIGGGAIALLVFVLLFDWLGVDFGEGGRPAGAIGFLPTGLDRSSSGWQAFTVARWIWLATILIALAVAFSPAVVRAWPDDGPPGALVVVLGALSSLLILYRIVHHPIADAAKLHASAHLKLGIWLGLIAALAIAYGGYVQLDDAARASSGDAERGEDAFGGITVAGGEPSTQPPPEPPAERPAEPPAEPPARDEPPVP